MKREASSWWLLISVTRSVSAVTVAVRGPPVEKGDLAEELTGSEGGHGLAVYGHGGGALDDDDELPAQRPLVGDYPGGMVTAVVRRERCLRSALVQWEKSGTVASSPSTFAVEMMSTSLLAALGLLQTQWPSGQGRGTQLGRVVLLTGNIDGGPGPHRGRVGYLNGPPAGFDPAQAA